MTDPVAAFAAAFAALYAAHQVADHWVQTQYQADHKGQPGWTGRMACLAHVITYTTIAAMALAAVALVTGQPFQPVPTYLGLTISAICHYIADRRIPLRRMADALGKDAEWLEHGGGLYALDQSWHVGWLFIASLVVIA